MALTADEQRATIELADRLAIGDVRALASLFEGRNVPTPTICWAPKPADMAASQLAFLLDYWQRLRRDGAMAPAKAIAPIEMRPALGYVCLIDVLEDALDFHYRVYGSDIAHCVGADLTGTRLSDYARSRWMLVYHAAAYRASAQRHEPLFTSYVPTADIATPRWDRLILPLADDDGRAARLLVGKVPQGRRVARRDPA